MVYHGSTIACQGHRSPLGSGRQGGAAAPRIGSTASTALETKVVELQKQAQGAEGSNGFALVVMVNNRVGQNDV